MGLLELFCDAVEVASNVGKVVLAPVEVIAKGACAASKVVADIAEDLKDAITK